MAAIMCLVHVHVYKHLHKYSWILVLAGNDLALMFMFEYFTCTSSVDNRQPLNSPSVMFRLIVD